MNKKLEEAPAILTLLNNVTNEQKEEFKKAIGNLKARKNRIITKHEKNCMQPKLGIIHYDQKRKAHWINLPDAPVAGPNDIYYCPTCGVKL